MFQNISWQSYWTAIAFATASYYFFIYLLYFRKSIQLSTFKSKGTNNSFNSSFHFKNGEHPSLSEAIAPEFEQPPKGTEEHVVYACIDELNAFFDNQRKSKAVKSEVMFALYGILQKYPSLKSSEYKESLTNVIVAQCENICSIHLSVEEMKGVWFG